MSSPADFLKWCEVFGVQYGGGTPGKDYVTPLEANSSYYNTSADTGASGASYVATYPLTGIDLQVGNFLYLDPANTNTSTTPQLNVNATGNLPIVNALGGNITLGDIIAGQTAILYYGYFSTLSSYAWGLLNPQNGPFVGNIQGSQYTSSADTGSDGTAYIATLIPAAPGLIEGMQVTLIPANSNSIVAPTLTLNSFSALTIYTPGQNPLVLGDINPNTPAVFILYNNGSSKYWILQNPCMSATTPIANNDVLANTSGGSAPAYGINLSALFDAVFGNTEGDILSRGASVWDSTQTLPSEVQANITELGTQSQALNMGGYQINNLADPSVSTDAATKNYCDMIAGGLNPVTGVYSASTANLTGYTYNNGTAGVGATLTAGSNGVFTEDGVSPVVGSRWLYKNDTDGSGAYNGIYIVTTSTSGSPAVLTRSTDYDTAAQIQKGDLIAVEYGTLNEGSSWLQTATVVTIGTDPIAFSVFFSPAAYLQVANNLSDLASVTTAVANLGLTIGTDTQAYSAYLSQIAGLSPAQGDIMYYNGSDWVLLAYGTKQQIFQTQGASANPVWANNIPTWSRLMQVMGA